MSREREKDYIDEKPMTENMIRFCHNYIDTRNATRSYAKAYGYQVDDPEQREAHYNSWSVASHNLLKDTRVRDYINNKLKDMDHERELSDKEIIIELNRIALGRDLYKEGTRLKAIQELIKVKGMVEDNTTASSDITINLASELEDQIMKSREPLDE